MLCSVMTDDTKSMADIVRDSTANVLKKVDEQVPLYVRMNMEMSRAYHQLVESLLEYNYSLERALPKAPSDQVVPWTAEAAIRMYSGTLMAQAEMCGGFMKWYPQAYVSIMTALDHTVRNYTKMADATASHNADMAGDKR